MESASDNAEARPLGRILSDERERQGLSRADAAQRLHMSAYQVEALETGDYSALPRGTFLRGFVRNYARFLGLDPDAALSHLAQAAPRGPAPGIVVPSQNIRFDPLGERLSNPYVKAGALAVVAVALAFAGMYWWLFIRPTPPASAAKKPAAEHVPSNGPTAGTPPRIAAVPVAAAEPVEPAPAPLVAAMPKAEVVKRSRGQTPERQQEAGSPTPKVLKFRFRGASWVEIRDGEGTVLLSRINAPGSEAEVAGRPPFTVIVGNAPEVRVLYNDREFPLEPHTKVAVARFTIE